MSEKAQASLKALMEKLAGFLKTQLIEEDGIFQLRAPTTEGRFQNIGAALRLYEEGEFGVFFSEIGDLTADIDRDFLLTRNMELRYSKVGIMNNKIGVFASVNMAFTTAQEALAVMQEVCMEADRLEQELFNVDVA